MDIKVWLFSVVFISLKRTYTKLETKDSFMLSKEFKCMSTSLLVQLTGTVEYVDRFSAEELPPPLQWIFLSPHFSKVPSCTSLSCHFTKEWSSRLGLHLCWGVRLPHKCPGYDTKQSDGEASVMLELWGMWNTPSLPSLPGPLWPGVIAPDKVPSMGQIELNCVLILNWIT